jgi:hypothetical protein
MRKRFAIGAVLFLCGALAFADTPDKEALSQQMPWSNALLIREVLWSGRCEKIDFKIRGELGV